MEKENENNKEDSNCREQIDNYTKYSWEEVGKKAIKFEYNMLKEVIIGRVTTTKNVNSLKINW